MEQPSGRTTTTTDTPITVAVEIFFYLGGIYFSSFVGIPFLSFRLILHTVASCVARRRAVFAMLSDSLSVKDLGKRDWSPLTDNFQTKSTKFARIFDVLGLEQY